MTASYNNITAILSGKMKPSIPPHNVAEICDCLAHLLKTPNARIETLVNLMPGPDFPTGGLLCETRETIVEAYRTGRGSFRIRAKWVKEGLKGGGYQIVVTEIPYQVAKSRLIEKIAELLQDKKLPFLDDINDESTTDIRLVLTPKSRNVEPEHLMEQLFRQTDLETRFSLNMNRRSTPTRRRASWACRKCCRPISTIAASCCSGAQSIASRKSSIASKSWAAT